MHGMGIFTGIYTTCDPALEAESTLRFEGLDSARKTDKASEKSHREPTPQVVSSNPGLEESIPFGPS